MDVLVTDSLTKTFGKKTALNNFSIRIPEGSIYGLLGPNGAGKTTFLRIVNQITGPDSGTVQLNGEPLNPSHIPMVGYMPEERGLYKNMKVGEQAVYFAKLKGLKSTEAKKRAKYWFDKLDISSWWEKKLSELSKGMGQKVQFVTTVIHEPELLIFDEPFSGFDPVNAGIIANEILELSKKGTTIIFSTHRMESVEEMCDHIALINLSNKVLDGPIKDIRNQYRNGLFNIELEIENEEEFHRFSNQFDLNELKQEDQRTSFKLKLEKGTNPNEAIQHFMQFGRVFKFEEVLPSVNDIFLTAVEQSNH